MRGQVLRERNIPLSLKLELGFKYSRTMLWLLKQGKLLSLYNFLRTKTTVLTGESSGAFLAPLIVPFLKRHPEKAPLPNSIEIEQCNYCPFRCIMCETTYWHEKPARFTLEEHKALTSQLPLAWCNNSGIGEPSLNPDLLKILEYEKRCGIFANLVENMNGQYWNEEKIEKIIKLGVDSLWISLDAATPETYHKLRPHIDFNAVLENIHTLFSLKEKYRSPVPEVCFRFVLNSLNYHELPDMVDLIASFGTQRIRGTASRLEFVGILSFPEIRDLYLDKCDMPAEILEETAKRAEEKDVLVVYSHASEADSPPMEHCFVWAQPYVLASGEVVPCCATLMSNNRDHLRKYSFGNAKKEKFREIWNSPYYRWFRKAVVTDRMPVPAFCHGCRAYNTRYREVSYGVDTRTKKDFE